VLNACLLIICPCPGLLKLARAGLSMPSYHHFLAKQYAGVSTDHIRYLTCIFRISVSDDFCICVYCRYCGCGIDWGNPS
jgi:hypothetical protein